MSVVERAPELGLDIISLREQELTGSSWTAYDLFARSRLLAVDGANLLHDRRGQIMQFGVDEAGELTWMGINDSKAQSVVTVDYQAGPKFDAFAWQLTIADSTGCEKTKFFVTETELRVYKTTHNQQGSVTSEDVPITNYEADLSRLMFIVSSEELSEQVTKMDAKREASEQNLCAMAIELTQQNFDKRKIKKKMEDKEKGLQTYGFGKILPIEISYASTVDVEPRVAYTDFRTGAKMMYDPVTRQTYWQ